MSYVPRTGDYGVVKTNGIAGRLIRVGTLARWNHAVIYVGNGLIVEANPTGVALSPITKYENIAWNQHEVISPTQRLDIALYAQEQVGRPYSFGVITILVLRILGLKALSKSHLAHWLADKTGYICSELVAECYRKAGVRLSSKLDYLVVPGDLAERLIYQ